MADSKSLTDPVSQPAPRRRAPAKNATSEPTRRAALGDTSGAKTTTGVVKRAVRASMDAAQVSKQAAVKDILENSNDKLEALRVLLAGSSPDDAAVIRQMLLDSQRNPTGSFSTPDEELASAW